jgi:hypothetical protein
LESEVARKRHGARIGQHALDLPAAHFLVAELPAHGEIAQLVVRNGIP